MVRREILRQVGSPHETPRFPQHFADFRASEINLKKVADFCCGYPNDGFNSPHRRQSRLRKTERIKMENNESKPVNLTQILASASVMFRDQAVVSVIVDSSFGSVEVFRDGRMFLKN